MRAKELLEGKDKDISSSERTERMLKLLRARYPMAQNDIEAMLYAFQAAQEQDRQDISRLDTENDAEEREINQIERALKMKASEFTENHQIDENLRKWFKEKWVRFGPDGKIRGDCARGDDSEGKPKCLPQSKAHSLGKKGRASAAARKRREDPNPERSGKAINVNTKKKSNESTGDRPHDPAPGKEFVSNKHLVKFTPTAIEIYHGGELVLSKPGDFSNPTRQDMYNARRYTTDLFNKKLKQQDLANLASKGVAEGSEDRRRFIRHNIWTAMDSDEEVLQHAVAGDPFYSAKKFMRDLDDQGYDFTHVISPKGEITYSPQHDPRHLNNFPDQGVAEEHHSESCPHCGGEMVSEELMNEKKDACYYKVKSRYKVWPSAYASGALVKCRKKGADSWGNGGKKNESIEEANTSIDASQALQKLKQIAEMRSKFTYHGLQEAGHADIVLNALKACSAFIDHFKNNNQIDYVQNLKKLQTEIIAFKNADAFTTLGQLLQGTLGKINFQQGVAEDQLDEKWTKKYKDSINCSNPKGFSQRAHCAGRNKNEDVAEGEKIGGRYDPDDFDAMVGRLKKLAGAGPMKTVYDPTTRRYKNVPVAVQPAQQPRKVNK